MLVDVVASEAAKAVTASLADAGVAGIGQLIDLVRRKTGHHSPSLPSDVTAVAEMLAQHAERDPQWLAEMTRELAQRVPLTEGAIEPPPAPFYDRSAQRAAVTDRGLCIVAGQRGSGKTALARQLAADLVNRSLVGQASLDMDVFRDGDVARLAEAKRHVLRQLGVTDVAAAEPDLSFQYLRAPLHRRFVLVIDNLVSAEEVRVLAPGWPASTVIATTRNLTDDLRGLVRRSRCVELDGLDDDGAWAMLASRCAPGLLDAEPEATRELLDQFGRLPFAIEQLGVTLARRSGQPQPVATVLEDFRQRGITDTNELIARTLTATVDTLSASARKHYLFLAAHPGRHFTVGSADALLGESSRHSLDELTDAGLVTRSGSHYQIPWFARQYAKEHAEQFDAESSLAFDRVLTYFVGRAVAADLAGGDRLRRYQIPTLSRWPEDEDRIDWLDAERDTLAELVEQAYLQGRFEQAVQLCGALEVLLLHRGRYELCLLAFGLGLQAAHELGRPGLTARMYGLRGRIFTLLHLFEPASAELDRAWRHVHEVDDPELTSSTWEFTGRLAEEEAGRQTVARYGPAIDAFTHAVEIDRRTGHRRALGLHTRMLGNVLVKAGRPDEALVLLAEAGVNTTDPRNSSRVCTVRAKALLATGDLPDARSEIDRARWLADQTGATQYAYELVDIEAEVAFYSDDIGTARSHWGWLAQEHLNAGHPKAEYYLAQLNRLQAPPV